MMDSNDEWSKNEWMRNIISRIMGLMMRGKFVDERREKGKGIGFFQVGWGGVPEEDGGRDNILFKRGFL